MTQPDGWACKWSAAGACVASRFNRGGGGGGGCVVVVVVVVDGAVVVLV